MHDNNILQQAARAGAPPQHRFDTTKRILVVDDEPSILKLNTAALERHGYKVDAAADGTAAWQALNTSRYDLLLTDNSMPGMSGVDLVRSLRDARMPLPVIMATGQSPDHEFNRYPWLQPVTVLFKPYDIPQLIRTVQEVLQSTQGTREPSPAPPSWRPRTADANTIAVQFLDS